MAKNRPALKPGATGGLKVTKHEPKAPTSPPAGTYDPALDAQVRASERGLRQLHEDVDLSTRRAGEDLATAQAGYGRNRGRSLEDLGTTRTRDLEDFSTREQRGTRDLDEQLSGIFRQFGILGSQQSQAANAAGVLRGGTLRSAEKKRAANQALARRPVDFAREDLMADLLRGRGRTEEDYGRGVGRTEEDYQTGVAGANRSYSRGQEDLFTKLQRAISEQSFYGQDIGAQRWWQASQNNPDLLAALGGGGGGGGKGGGGGGGKKKPGLSSGWKKK